MILVIIKGGYCHSCRWLEAVASNNNGVMMRWGRDRLLTQLYVAEKVLTVKRLQDAGGGNRTIG